MGKSQKMAEEVLQVRVRPDAKRTAILGYSGDILEVAVAAVPHEGKANEALLALLANTLGIRKSDLSLRRGERARLKLVAVHGVTAGQLVARLQDAVNRPAR